MRVLFAIFTIFTYCLTFLVSSPDASDDTALHKAARQNKIKTLKKLLQQDPSLLDRRGNDAQTALFASVLAGAQKSVEYLLAIGADINIPNSQGYTLIDAAAFQGRASIAILLLKHGFDASYINSGDGETPLHRAAWGREQRHTETVKAFLEAGVSADVKNRNGDAPLKVTNNEETKMVFMERLADDKAKAAAEL
jgi:ankyrin repeat protein